jgi:hypothetical protein
MTSLSDNGLDAVNHPPHYTMGRYETIDVLEDVTQFAPSPVLGSLQWQTLKYLLRLWHKDCPGTDARKAQWYLERLVSRLPIDKDRLNSLAREDKANG